LKIEILILKNPKKPEFKKNPKKPENPKLKIKPDPKTRRIKPDFLENPKTRKPETRK
jgi:hypothetical protein